MKIRVRLYHYHDLDLVSLYREGRISIPKAVKLTLNAFAQKNYVRLETDVKKCEKIAKPVYMFNIVLNEKKDKAAIDLLDKIDKGYRNNFIKQLLRVYLCFVLPGCYTDPKNLAYFAEREKGIFSERKAIPAPVSKYVRKKLQESSGPVILEVPSAEVEVGGLVIKDLERKQSDSVEEKYDGEERAKNEILKDTGLAGTMLSAENGIPQNKENWSVKDMKPVEEIIPEVSSSEDRDLDEEKTVEDEAQLLDLFKNMVH